MAASGCVRCLGVMSVLLCVCSVHWAWTVIGRWTWLCAQQPAGLQQSRQPGMVAAPTHASNANCFSVLLCCCCDSENVVHGDLKAGNVLLTTGGADQDGLWQRLAGSAQRIVAKVGDMGLSFVLDPNQTHGSFTARVSLAVPAAMVQLNVPTLQLRGVWLQRVCVCGQSCAAV